MHEMCPTQDTSRLGTARVKKRGRIIVINSMQYGRKEGNVGTKGKSLKQDLTIELSEERESQYTEIRLTNLIYVMWACRYRSFLLNKVILRDNYVS